MTSSSVPKVPFERLQQLGDKLLKYSPLRPKISIVCGSGLGGLADMVTDKVIVPYEQMEILPKSTVPGHEGKFVFGKLNGIAVLLIQGRIHPYEGHSTYTCSLPIQLLKFAGVNTVLLTNAAGGLNDQFKVGDFMILRDHISLPCMAGLGPLVGPNDERLGLRFIPLSDAYDANLRNLCKRVSEQIGEKNRVHEGVYAHAFGPQFETIAECLMLKRMGGDAVGMSTAYEVITARHIGMRVFAVSLITNKVVTDYESTEKANHLEVLEVGKQRAVNMQNLISAMITQM